MSQQVWQLRRHEIKLEIKFQKDVKINCLQQYEKKYWILWDIPQNMMIQFAAVFTQLITDSMNEYIAKYQPCLARMLGPYWK